jgi:hypothetical protein
MTNSKQKGNKFEILIATSLSLWWSGGAHDDWFFRSSNSGGRATERAKAGKRTLNSAGDLQAQCHEAQKLLDLLCIENKKGYNHISVADLWEKSKGGFHDFVSQSQRSASLAGACGWAVIHKRDRKNAVIHWFLPSRLISSELLITESLETFLTEERREFLQKEWMVRFGEKET